MKFEEVISALKEGKKIYRGDLVLDPYSGLMVPSFYYFVLLGSSSVMQKRVSSPDIDEADFRSDDLFSDDWHVLDY